MSKTMRACSKCGYIYAGSRKGLAVCPRCKGAHEPQAVYSEIDAAKDAIDRLAGKASGDWRRGEGA